MSRFDELNIKVYNINDIAKMLFLNEETVRKMVKKNRLKAISQGAKKNGYLILGSQLQDFLDKNEKYRERYNTYVEAHGDTVKSTTLKDFILEYLYGVIPFKEWKTLYEIDGCFSIKLMLRDLKKHITEDSYNVITTIIRETISHDKKDEESQ